MKLYHAPDTRSVRILWLLEELGLSYDLHSMKLGDPSMREPEFLAVHPMGRVPVLEDGEVRLFESGAIAEYLVETHAADTMRPDKSDPLYADYLQWMHYAEGMIMPPVNVIVVETILLPPERRNDINVARAKKLLTRMLGPVDQALDNRDFLCGDFSAADIMTGHATMAAVRFGADISETKNIKGYIARLESREALTKARSIQ